MDNSQIARTFDELADLLELAGESPFKLRAYRNFAELARETGEVLEGVAERGELEKLEGVGPAIAKKVKDLLDKGTFDALDKARAAIPRELPELLRVPGLGSKTVRKLYEEAGVKSLAELVAALENGSLSTLAGFGAKKQEKTLAAVKLLLAGRKSMLLGQARGVAAQVAAWLGASAGSAVELALIGPAARGAELVETVPLLVRGLLASEIVRLLGPSEPSSETGEADLRPISALTLANDEADRVHLQVDGHDATIRVVPAEAWTHALLVGTSDEAHLAWLEGLAGDAKKLAAICAKAQNDNDVYTALGVRPVPLELREGAAPVMPEELVGTKPLGGVFHVHSDWSDGTATITEMLQAAKEAGLGYIGLSDHSRAAWYANGLDESRLEQQMAEVEAARKAVPDVKLFHGIEVDILSDGALDLPDEILSRLDFVIASVHSQLAMDSETMTKRLVRAVSHPLVTILGHPTGRLLLARKGTDFDVAEVARAAAKNGTCLEINANPQRLDLSEPMVRAAKAEGASFAIDPDAHGTRGFDDTALGLMVARRAALSSQQVLNAQSPADVEQTLAKRKSAALERLAPRA